MDSVTLSRNRWQFAIKVAIVGFAVAAAFFLYFETDPPLESPTTARLGEIALLLCPGSLLFITLGWIDVEPQTVPFAVMWLVIGLINFLVYGAIGALVGSSFGKPDSHAQKSDH